MKRFATILVALCLVATTAHAEKAIGQVDAASARLGTLNAKERALLAPHLREGPVLLTEFRNAQSELPAIIFVTEVAAPAKTVADIVAKPSDYPKFMPSLDSIQVESSYGDMMSYAWTWKVAMFTLNGRNIMTTFPRKTDSNKPYRIDVRNTGGDMGVGRMIWRIYPKGPKRSLVVFSSRIDMRDSNYIAEQLSAGGNSVNRTINITLASVMLLGTKAHAEKAAGTFGKGFRGQAALKRPKVDISKFSSMLRRGDLVFMKMKGDNLQQVAVLGRSGVRENRVRRVMNDPEEFGKSLLKGSRAEIIERKGERVLFEWGVPLPLVGVGGTMWLKPSNSVIEVEGKTGSFSDSQWRFDTFRYPSGEAAVLGWSQFDPANTAKFIKRLIAGNAHFSHGLAAAMQLMVMRSLRSRVRRRL